MRWTARWATWCAPTSPRPACIPMHRIWDEGFREITSEHQARSRRRRTCTASRSACRPARSRSRCSRRSAPSPVTINAAELYTALQTHVADGQENPLGNIQTHEADAGAEILLPDQPHVGRLLAADERRRSGTGCRRNTRRSSPTRSTRRRWSSVRPTRSSTRRWRRCSRSRAWNSQRRPATQFRAGAGQGRLLQGVAGEVRPARCGRRWSSSSASSPEHRPAGAPAPPCCDGWTAPSI